MRIIEIAIVKIDKEKTVAKAIFCRTLIRTLQSIVMGTKITESQLLNLIPYLLEGASLMWTYGGGPSKYPGHRSRSRGSLYNYSLHSDLVIV